MSGELSLLALCLLLLAATALARPTEPEDELRVLEEDLEEDLEDYEDARAIDQAYERLYGSTDLNLDPLMALDDYDGELPQGDQPLVGELPQGDQPLDDELPQGDQPQADMPANEDLNDAASLLTAGVRIPVIPTSIKLSDLVDGGAADDLNLTVASHNATAAPSTTDHAPRSADHASDGLNEMDASPAAPTTLKSEQRQR